MIYNNQGNLESEKDLYELIEEGYLFDNVDLSNRDLRSLNCNQMFFDNCDFTGSDLSGATFVDTHLRGATFDGGKLIGTTFIRSNMREASFKNLDATGATFKDCMIISTLFNNSNLSKGSFEGSDMRKSNLRNANCSKVNFDGVAMKGTNFRNTCLNRSSIPHFMNDKILEYKLCGDDSIHYAYKLTNEDSRGIYHPTYEYTVGETYTVEDIHEITNPGIAIAPLDWLFREWVMLGCNPNWRLYRVSFRAGDILQEEGSIKFNVRSITIENEIDIKPFYKLLRD